MRDAICTTILSIIIVIIIGGFLDFIMPLHKLIELCLL